MHQVIYGHSRSDRIANHISRHLDIPVKKLWPQRYGERKRASA